MSPRQYRTRTAVRFATLLVVVALWFFLAHAIPAAAVMVVGL